MTTRVEQSLALCAQSRSLVANTNVLVALSWRIRNGWLGISGGSDVSSAIPGSPRWPLDELEGLVRHKLMRGALFVLENGKHWAGPATGKRCIVCTLGIFDGNECEIRAPRGYVYAHLLCHRVWSQESEARRSRNPVISPGS